MRFIWLIVFILAIPGSMLVVSTLLKNISLLGCLFPTYGKIKKMFQTTNHLVAHPTNRKWVIIPVINGIFVGLIHFNHWGELTHKNEPWDEPPTRDVMIVFMGI